MHVDHVGLSVADLDRMSAWYTEAFDWSPVPGAVFELPAARLRVAFLAGPDGIALELLEKQGSEHAPVPESPSAALLRQGWGHVCLRVADVDALHAHLVSLGATTIAAPGPAPEPGVRFAFVADPEGNLIEILDRTTKVGG